MKTQKTNTIQLIIAGFVVVLVAVCATFAWYASGDRSWVEGIFAKMESPSTEESIDSGISEIQIYDPVSENWENYDGEIPLDFVPGQLYNFKVLFKADRSQQVWLRLTGFEVPEEPDNTPYLAKVLQYSVKFNEQGEDNYSYFNIDHIEDNKTCAVLIDGMQVSTDGKDNFISENGTYVLYYSLMLPGGRDENGNEIVDNKYFNLSFKADVELIFQ